MAVGDNRIGEIREFGLCGRRRDLERAENEYGRVLEKIED